MLFPDGDRSSPIKTLKPALAFLLAAGLILGVACRHPSAKPVPWLWPGANHNNTMWFSQRGTQPRAGLNYRAVWEAEHYALEDFESPPLVAVSCDGLMTLDEDGDGRLEIVPEPASQSPRLALDKDGLPVEPRGPAWRIVLPDNDTTTTALEVVPDIERDTMRNGQYVWLLSVNGRRQAISMLMQDTIKALVPNYGLRSDAPGNSWRYPTAPRALVWAATDVDGDGASELLAGTYGEEHGWRVNGTTDSDSCYCLALSDRGALKWQRGFGAWSFAGCRACCADLDADGSTEVIVACHTWRHDGGGLYVLRGATGAVLAATPGPGDTTRSFGSVGCADMDGDGRPEIVAAWSGATAGVAVYRFREGRLELVHSVETGRATDSCEVRSCRLDAICDLDGNGAPELVLSQFRQQYICLDPVFYPARFDSCRVTVLGADLAERCRIDLAERAEAVIVSDILPGGNMEIIIRSDRLTLLSTDRPRL